MTRKAAPLKARSAGPRKARSRGRPDGPGLAPISKINPRGIYTALERALGYVRGGALRGDQKRHERIDATLTAAIAAALAMSRFQKTRDEIAPRHVFGLWATAVQVRAGRTAEGSERIPRPSRETIRSYLNAIRAHLPVTLPRSVFQRLTKRGDAAS